MMKPEPKPSAPRRPKFGPAGLSYGKNWIKLDSEGRRTYVAMDRQKLTQHLGVRSRDLRILDPKFSTSYSSAILCRDHALVVNLEHIKAILTPTAVFVMSHDKEEVVHFIRSLEERLCTPNKLNKSASCPSLHDSVYPKQKTNGKVKGWQIEDMSQENDPSSGISPLENRETTPLLVDVPVANGFERGLWEQEIPFELRALEVCLESICRNLDNLTTELEAEAFPALDVLPHKVNTSNLQAIRSIKSKMVRLQTRVETIHEILGKFLDDDSDMKAMNLTAKLHINSGPDNDTEVKGCSKSSSCSSDSDEEEEFHEVEMLLEAYFMQLDKIQNRLNTLCNYIDNTEDYVNIQQDKHRNQLLKLELLITAATFALTFIGVIGGIFGMNLKNNHEESNSTFVLVSTLTSASAVGVFIGLLVFSRLSGLMFN